MLIGKNDWLVIGYIFVSNNLKVCNVRLFLQSVSLFAMPLFHATGDIFRFDSFHLFRSRNSYDLSYLSVLFFLFFSFQAVILSKSLSAIVLFTGDHSPPPTFSLIPQFRRIYVTQQEVANRAQRCSKLPPFSGTQTFILLKYTLLSCEWMDLKSKAFTLLQLFPPSHWQLIPSLTMPSPQLSIRSVQVVPD